MSEPSDSLFKKIALGKCPVCGKGEIFHKGSLFFKVPKMKENCDVCGHHFEREPGYFLGAMYVSYGLAVLQGIITFLICYFLFNMVSELKISLVILVVIAISSMWNYKFSRVIWMYIFPK